MSIDRIKKAAYNIPQGILMTVSPKGVILTQYSTSGLVKNCIIVPWEDIEYMNIDPFSLAFDRLNP